MSEKIKNLSADALNGSKAVDVIDQGSEPAPKFRWRQQAKITRPGNCGQRVQLGPVELPTVTDRKET